MSSKRLIPVLSYVVMCLFFGFNGVSAAESVSVPSHAVAMSGTPKYPDGFTHFDYANPDAPKGGHLRMAAIGTYDSFNPFIAKGVAASGIGLLYDTLMVNSDDEPFTYYGLIAEKIDVAKDRSYVIFHLNPRARFHDGRKVTSSDVVFSFNTLIEKGTPLYKKYYHDVEKVEAIDDSRVKFFFSNTENPELPLIIGQIAVLPMHFWKGRDFSKSSLEIPVGSGPYLIERFQPGRGITFKRNENYWAKDLPVNRGRYNFDRITYDYYRDQTVSLEAFKAGEYDFRQEYTAKSWATLYNGPNFDRKLIIKEEIPHEIPQGMQCFVFNTRKSVFGDRMVRKAIGYAFDFEWSNKNLFYGQYKRTESFFSNSELGAKGLPSPEELEILEPLKGRVPDEVFTKVYRAPSTAGDTTIRQNLRTASALLEKAGWGIQNRKRVNRKTGASLDFEIILVSPAFERVVLPFRKNLARLGIDVRVRVVDTSQYVNRVRSFDYDMIVAVFPQSMSPGNEQRNFWGSASADIPGSRNYIGLRDPAVDILVEKVIRAPDRRNLEYRTRALDRVLLWGHYVIPQWHNSSFRVSYWNKFEKPPVSPKYGFGLYTWWIDTEKERSVESGKGQIY